MAESQNTHEGNIFFISAGRIFQRLRAADQIRRASVSIMSNIAEGFERSGTGEFIQFLSIAKGSVGEVKSQLYVALDQRYIDRKGFDEAIIMTTEVEKLIAGLMHYLRKAKIKGVKYKNS